VAGVSIPVVVEDWGWWRVTIDSTDVSRFRGAPVHASFEVDEPFGCLTAQIDIPAMTPLDTPGSGDVPWLRAGSPVDIWWLHPDGSTADSFWSGEVTGWSPTLDATSGTMSVQCIGDMNAASLQDWQPPPGMDPTDIGTVIASALNAVVGRRYRTISAPSTGILTTYLGADDQSVIAYVQELLSTAVTDDGTNQWTVRRVAARRYEIALKDVETTSLTVRAGQPGVGLQLQQDATLVPNRIFGDGVTSAGYAWRNMFYPTAQQNAGASYPFSDVSRTMSLGTTDVDTDTGTGVSDLQRRMNELNITPNVSVDGVLNSNDIAAIKVIQRYYGLEVDGIVGGQTWSATFDIGDGELGIAVRLPLAFDRATMPRLYRADGSDAGVNPHFDPTVLVVDKDISFGGGVSKADGRRAAQAMLARDYPTGLAGQITLDVDPQEASPVG
jgi:hypothetical protein